MEFMEGKATITFKTSDCNLDKSVSNLDKSVSNIDFSSK